MTGAEKLIIRIKNNLLTKGDDIKKEDLLGQIETFKSIPLENLRDVFDFSEENIDWGFITDRLLEQIAVTHKGGFGIEDDEANYNTSWFSEYLRENGRGYYWSRFIQRQTDILPPNVVKTVRDDSIEILNRCGAPDRKDGQDIRGLVFGYVQSGKTLNYTSLTNAAMDAGYNIIVVLAGATNILRKQTQIRVNSDVIGWDGKAVSGVGIVQDDLAKRPISLTTTEGDFNKKIATQQMQGANLSNTSTPIIAVVKKQVSAINNLNKWLDAQNRSGQIQKSILLIDDESDYASVNTRKNEDPTSINKGVRTMLNHFKVSTYVAITATPFANILINSKNEHKDLGQDLFPKSFIWSLNKPSTYSGVTDIVIDSFKDLYDCNPSLDLISKREECTAILKFKSKDSIRELPFFFDDVLSTFITDVYKLRVKRPEQDDVSMMVNISRFTRHHEEVSGLLELRKDRLIDSIQSLHYTQFKDPLLKLIRKKGQEAIDESDEKTFWEEIRRQLLSTMVVGVHKNSRIDFQFSQGHKLNFIMVGGLSLSRGFTIEGLITSVFLRSTRTYDALMQMGRWFGHKKTLKQLGVLSLFTTPEIQARYETIEQATVHLLDQIQIMKERKETPREFGLGIRYDPLAALQVVARNKSRSASRVWVHLGMNGRNCETTKLFIDEQIINNNKSCIESFLLNVKKKGEEVRPTKNMVYPSKHNNTFAYRNVDIALVLDFIREFDVPFKKLSQVSQKLPFPILERYIKEKVKAVDVIVIQGRRSDKKVNFKDIGCFDPSDRKFESRPGGYISQTNNQITIPSHERLLLSSDKCPETNERKLYRQCRLDEIGRPLLMIFPLIVTIDGEDSDKKRVEENYAWSISTPGKQNDEDGVLVYANNVLQEQLERDDDTFYLDNETDEEL